MPDGASPLWEWEQQLYVLTCAMENYFPDPPPGFMPSKLMCLTRYAWAEATRLRHEEDAQPDG